MVFYFMEIFIRVYLCSSVVLLPAIGGAYFTFAVKHDMLLSYYLYYI